MRDWGVVVRVVLGSYVAVHFAALLPYAVELFSTDGMLADAHDSPLLRAFPNVLALCDAPAVVLALVGLAAVSGVALAAGRADRAAAAIALYVSACLFGRNPLIANPSLPYVGLLLFAHAASRTRPTGEAWARPVLRALWIAMALGYSYSGITKLAAPSWIDGQAFAYILANPLARSSELRAFMASWPSVALATLTWGVLAFEIGFAPLAAARRLRPWLWSGMLLMHCGLLVLIDFADLTAGMVVLHIATFDPRWLPARWRARPGPQPQTPSE